MFRNGYLLRFCPGVEKHWGVFISNRVTQESFGRVLHKIEFCAIVLSSEFLGSCPVFPLPGVAKKNALKPYCHQDSGASFFAQESKSLGKDLVKYINCVIVWPELQTCERTPPLSPICHATTLGLFFFAKYFSLEASC